MAGTNQHYIPKLLQRGFLSRITKSKRSKKEYVYRFKRDGSPIERNIDKIASGNEFYSENETSTAKSLDDKITDYENKLALIVQDLRSKDSGSKVCAELAAEVVTHLSVRTSSLRETFWHGVLELTTQMQTAFTTRESMAEFIGLNNDIADSFFASQVREGIQRTPEFLTLSNALNMDISVFENMLIFLFREYFSSFSDLAIDKMRSTLSPLIPELPKTVKNGHNDALSTMMDSPPTRADLINMYWCVETKDEIDFILPDCVSISLNKDRKAFPFVLGKKEERNLIVLPLSYDRLLVGKSKKSHSFDPNAFNEFAASCSHEFFLAKDSSKAFCELTALIGTESKKFVKETIGDTLSILNGTQKSNERTDKEISISPLSDYQIRLFDFGTQEDVERFAGHLTPLISTMSRGYDLGLFQGVTIAYDYGAAIDEFYGNLEKTQENRGIASSPIFQDGNEIRFRTIIQYDVIHCLLDGDAQQQVFGLYVFINQAAYIHTVTSIHTCFPDRILKPLGQYHEGELFRIVYPAITDYLSTRASTGLSIDTENQQLFLDNVLQAFEHYTSELPILIQSYQDHLDVTRLFLEVRSVIGAALTALARYIGNSDGIDIDFLANTKLRNALDQHSLIEWSLRYARELRAIWNDFGAWNSFDTFTDMNMHVDRLMWRYGLFSWPQDGGSYVRVLPPEFDFNKLILAIPKAAAKEVLSEEDKKTFENLRDPNAPL